MWVPNIPVTILSAAVASGGLVCLYKDINGGPPFDKNVQATGLTVVITGATSGIGETAAWEFVKRGAKVFMACRDMTRCEEIRQKFVLDSRNKYVYCRPCDLASQQSVRNFAARFLKEEPVLDVLVNNAGVMETPQSVSPEGIETQLAVNHMSHFLLTRLLMPTLLASPSSRVISVTCDSYKKGRINKEDLNFSTKYDATAAYAQSKLANVLFARELGRRMIGKLSVIAVDPGFTDTNITRHMKMRKSFSRFIIYPLFWPTMKNPRIGSQPILHAALDPALKDCTGDLYVDMKKAELTEDAQDYELSQWLWKVSEKWTKLEEPKTAAKK